MRIKELDGLRGVAVLAVMDKHFLGRLPFSGSAYGWLGVDLFFVLSGFLITNILLGMRSEERYFSTFYSRRALRIFPPYFLGILVYLALSFALHSPGQLKLWLPYIFYYVSLYIHPPMPTLGAPFGVPVVVGFGLTVLWSLSVEEIYYTIWAPVVRFTNEVGFHCILIAMILIAPPLRWWLHTPGGDELFAFYCRMDGLAYGSAVALLIKHRRVLPRVWLTTDKYFDWAAAILISITVILWSMTGGDSGNHLASSVGLIFADVTFALFAYALIRHAGGNELWVRIFRAKWLCSIGKVSYSLYLFHYALGVVSVDIIATLSLPRLVSAVSRACLSFALSLAVAYALWYTMELRILRWKDRRVPRHAPAEAQVLKEPRPAPATDQ